jgi:hypothetical protein
VGKKECCGANKTEHGRHGTPAYHTPGVFPVRQGRQVGDGGALGLQGELGWQPEGSIHLASLHALWIQRSTRRLGQHPHDVDEPLPMHALEEIHDVVAIPSPRIIGISPGSLLLQLLLPSNEVLVQPLARLFGRGPSHLADPCTEDAYPQLPPSPAPSAHFSQTPQEAPRQVGAAAIARLLRLVWQQHEHKSPVPRPVSWRRRITCPPPAMKHHMSDAAMGPSETEDDCREGNHFRARGIAEFCVFWRQVQRSRIAAPSVVSFQRTFRSAASSQQLW